MTSPTTPAGTSATAAPPRCSKNPMKKPDDIPMPPVHTWSSSSSSSGCAALSTTTTPLAPQPPSPSHSWFQRVGDDDIYEVTSTANTHVSRIARGSFGDIHVALRRSPSSSLPSSRRWHLVAIKTIVNAVVVDARGDLRDRELGHHHHHHHPNGNDDEQGDDHSRQTPYTLARDVFHEIAALQLLRGHANIVPLIGLYPARMGMDDPAAGTALSLAFPYHPTDLHLALQWRARTCQSPLPFSVIHTMSLDLLSAIHYMHHSGVLHRDIKPGNCLVTSQGVLQLCDFGLAKPMPSSTHVPNMNDGVRHRRETDVPPHDPRVGHSSADPGGVDTGRGLCTLFYRPPEVLLGAPALHPSVDLWSCGTVIAELILGQPVFARGVGAQSGTVLDQLQRIFQICGTPDGHTYPNIGDLPDYNKFEFAHHPPQRWDHILPRLTECPVTRPWSNGYSFQLDLIARLLVLDPSKRLTAPQALRHARFTVAANQGADGKCSVDYSLQHHRERRLVVIQELIPPELHEPILLSTPVAHQHGNNAHHTQDKNDAIDPYFPVLAKQVRAMAFARRTFLTSKHLNPWHSLAQIDDDNPEKT